MHNYDYYKSFPGYLSMIGNISLVTGVVMLFFKWRVSIFLFAITVILWFIARNIHKKKVIGSLLINGLNKSVEKVAEKYKSPEGVAELKRRGLSDKEIRMLQKLAEEDAKKGIFSR